MPALYHGLYTNAFGERGQGFRHLFLAPDWPSADRQRISHWLQTLQPSAGSVSDAETLSPLDSPQGKAAERVAVNSFRIGSTLHACLARLDADFARDEHGRRGGVLVHALFVPLAEGRPAGHYSGALLLKSREFVRPDTADADRLEAYLTQCRAAREIALRTVDPAIFQRLDANFLIRFYAYSSGPPRSKDAVFAPAGAPLAAALAAASAGLPPRLRLACRWAVGLRPTPDMSFVARTAADGERLQPLPDGPGAIYTRWLRESYEAAVPESWDIRSWSGLTEWIRRR